MAGVVRSLSAGGHPLTTKVHHGRRTLSVVPRGKERRWPTLVPGIILLDQARRRFTPTLNNIPGMGVLEKRVLAHPWNTKVLAKPPSAATSSRFWGIRACRFWATPSSFSAKDRTSR